MTGLALRVGFTCLTLAQFDEAAFFPSTRYSSSLPPAIESDSRERPLKRNRPCKTYRGATHCGMEWDEWIMVDALVRPRHTVIEFGGRFGTTSCRLARATANSGAVAVVEPDSSVHKTLLHNRDAHRCSFHVVGGTVSDTVLSVATSTAKSAYSTAAVRLPKKGGRRSKRHKRRWSKCQTSTSARSRSGWGPYSTWR